MKNTILYLLLIAGMSLNASAQKNAQARSILNQVSQKYKSYAFIKSDFTFTIDDQQANIKQTQNGTLITQSKTNKFKVILYNPGIKTEIEQEIINDGKTQWTYVKKDKETEVSDADHNGAGFNPAQLFKIYEHGYKYLYTGEQKLNGIVYEVIDLTPEDDKKPFFKIRLLINKAKKQIFNALIFDKNGSKYSYTLRSFTAMAQLPDNTFTYNAKSHPGVEVVDLR